ncbi:hypothetical protein AK812_SmicGene14709 [Symbiodinium microadriaticum]|uniref:Uncharacterized protein n=1 Tax=Symbiodinium microadriaticum TaxID=2951 RepID=A0A1Q9E4U3_SYMMI|nr:hypothetical protein AK812_SmicGene14709 [Symbiodinium microadriaticum]
MGPSYSLTIVVAPVPERKLEILWATSGELLVTLMLPASSLIKDVKDPEANARLGIDVEMQKLVTEEAVLEDDQPLELDQLRLICLSPEYGLVVVEGTRSRDQRGEVREEGDTTHYHVQLEVLLALWDEASDCDWQSVTESRHLKTKVN